MRLWVILAILSVLSTTVKAEPMEINQQYRLDIERSLDGDEYEILLAGENEILLVINDSHTPITKGVVVLVNDYGQPPLGQFTLASLITHLNDTGWVTMLMPAPSNALYPEAPPEDSTNTIDENLLRPFNQAKVLSEQNFTQQEQGLVSQMRAIVNKSEAYPGFFMVISQGTSAAWLTKLYAENQLETPDAFITISPYWPQKIMNKKLPELMAQTSMPVLDIYNQWDNSWTLSTRKDRKVAAVKGLKMHYRQREIIGQNYDAQQFTYIGKEIYGWLTYMGW